MSKLGVKINCKPDLFKIWKNQSLSDGLIFLLKELMIAMDSFLKEKSPESLIEMWARKESCWELVKQQDFSIDFPSIKNDMIDDKNPAKRICISADEVEEIQKTANLEKIKSVSPEIWKRIEEWGNTTQNLSTYLQNTAYTLGSRIKSNSKIFESEVQNGLRILETVIDKEPILLFDIDSFAATEKINFSDISIETIKKMVIWDKKNKHLQAFQYRLMADLVEGRKPLSETNKKYATYNLTKLKEHGFIE